MWRRAGMTIWLGFVGLNVALAGQTAGWAAEKLEQKNQTTIQGEVVDPASYLKDGQHGQELTNRTYEASEGGQTLAILEDGTNVLYLLLAEEAGEDPNELAYDYTNQKVKVTGRLYERSGVRGIVPTSIEPVGGTAATPIAAPSKSSNQTLNN